MKKFFLLVILALALAVAGIFLLWQKNSAFKAESPLYGAISPDTPLFIEVKSVKSLPAENPIVKKLSEAGFLGGILSEMNKLDSLAAPNLKESPFIVAVSPENLQETSFLLIARVHDREIKKALDNLLGSLYPSGKFRTEKQRCEGRKISSLISLQNIFEFSYCFTNGLLIASPKEILVEKAIRQIDSGGLSSDARFIQVNKTATRQNNASVYINHRYFPGFAKKWMNQESSVQAGESGLESQQNTLDGLKSLAGFASWTELDLNIGEEAARLNGISVTNDSLNQFLPVFAGQQPVGFEADNILPKNTPLFLSFTFSDREKFFSNLHAWQKSSGDFQNREEKIRQMRQQSGGDILALFENMAGQEIAVAFTNIPENPSGKETVFIVSVKGQNQAKEGLANWLEGYAAKANTNLKALTETYEIDRETKFNYYRFPFPNLPGIWLGGPFCPARANYAGFCDNFIIFTSSESAMEKLLLSHVLESNLANDISYQKFKQNTDSKTNINFFIDINEAFPLSSEIFSGKALQFLKSKQESIRNFPMFNWQVINTGNLFFNSLTLNYSEKIEEGAKTVWQSNIGSRIRQKPGIVINHEEPKNREIIVQDEKNILHQITKDGRVRWSINLTEEIIGEIHQADFKRNGKLQYVFNTKTQLCMLDRNGNNVPPFPVSLRSPATNEVSVFDYDNNRKYRYFVAGEDKKIYAFDESGKLLQGWNFGKTDQAVVTPIQHFRVGGKDYIVFTDGLKVYILDRRGESRVKIPATTEFSKNPLFLNTSGTPKIIAADKTGNVYYLYFNGKISQKKMPIRNENFFFEAADLDGNGSTDFVFLDGNELFVIDENGKPVFSEVFSANLPFRPEIITIAPKQKKIGVVNVAENRIYLFNPDGTLYDGFPLAGNSLFSIGRLTAGSDGQNLIVGSEDGNISNYRVD